MTVETPETTPVARPVRPWTPDQLVVMGNGESGRRLSVKRACSTCGEKVGDVTDAELAASMDVRNRRVPLLPVTDECWKCSGVHALFADPAPRRYDWRADDVDTWEIKLLCPGKRPGEARLRCASFQQCGCVPPTDDPLTEEFERFLERPCPASPDGGHMYVSDKRYVGAPTGPCAYVGRDDLVAAAEELIGAPGIYPVEITMVPLDDPMEYGNGATGLRFEPVDLRQRDAAPAAG